MQKQNLILALILVTADPILQRKEFEIRGRTKNLIRIVSHCYREGMSRCRINTLCEPILRTKDLEITIETKDLFCLACLSWPSQREKNVPAILVRMGAFV